MFLEAKAPFKLTLGSPGKGAAKKEEAKPKKEEPKEESDEDMGFGLFD